MNKVFVLIALGILNLVDPSTSMQIPNWSDSLRRAKIREENVD